MSNIKIYARIRNHESENVSQPSYMVTRKEHNIQIKQEKLSLANDVIIEKSRYTFDKVFDKCYSNTDIYHDIGCQLMNNIFNKKDSVFYVYGQTGSGKTFTLLGNEENIGIIEMLLLDMAANRRNITYNGIQIYNNRCYDIFNKNVLKECECYDGSVEFLNVSTKEICFEQYSETENNILDEIRDIIIRIKEARHVGISSSNKTSSRSHFIFQLFYDNHYIKIIDLAGSERATRSMLNKEHNFRENADINLGILALKECIRSLGIKNKKPPYRDSKITKILKNTFTSNIHTYILSTISPLKQDILDTRDTLKYISGFKKVKENPQKKMEPIQEPSHERVNKLNERIQSELQKPKVEKQKLLGLIEENIKSLKDLKQNIINI